MTATAPGAARDDLVIRRAVEADRGPIASLLAVSLGRQADDARFDVLFAWKHERNPFGASPMWVACDGDRIVGFRVLMRWQFERGGHRFDAVRAVDTATHPEYQGRGIFTRLTLHALDDLRAAGVDFVFNTPNEQSRPGYLKMGWSVVGRVPVVVRPKSIGALARIARSRVPAERWSEPLTAGEPVEVALEHPDQVAALLASQPSAPRLRTARSVEYLQWRYGIETLGYRVFVGGGGPRDGVAFVRVRRRGAAREAVVADVIAPGGSRAATARLIRQVCREVDADYAIRVGAAVAGPDGFVRLPRQGPILTWRAVCETQRPALREWELSLGDIELF
jgi:GNAT superfamily N-acetyltransferase